MSETTNTPTAQVAPVVAEQPKPQAPAPAAPAPETQTQGEPAEAPLGEPGLKALREERAARERLEQAMKDQRTQLLKAFGVETETPGQDIVTTLQQQVAGMVHTNLVNDVARGHGITSDDDMALLRDVTDEATMRRLAARLASTAPQAPTSPLPDPAQGRAASPEQAQDAEYRAFFPQSSK